MTRALNTFSAIASARTTSSAKTAARAFMRQTGQTFGAFGAFGAFDRLLGDEARSARTVGHRWTGIRNEMDTTADALAMRCVLD